MSCRSLGWRRVAHLDDGSFNEDATTFAVRGHRPGLLRSGGGPAGLRRPPAASCARSFRRTKPSCARSSASTASRPRSAYDQYDEYLRSGEVDAVYIALPNDLHRDYTVRAARAGVHVLCEKPMADQQRAMPSACSPPAPSGVRLMVAYRLHFEGATLEAIERVQRGEMGRPRFFSSTFAMQVQDDNIRTRRARGGGPLLDLGIYCVNAARALFRAEPIEVAAMSAPPRGDRRFKEIDEQVTAVLRFPDDRLAQLDLQLRRLRSLRAVGDRDKGAPAHGSRLRVRDRPDRRGRRSRRARGARRSPSATRSPPSWRLRGVHPRTPRARALGRGRAGRHAGARGDSARGRERAAQRSSGRPSGSPHQGAGNSPQAARHARAGPRRAAEPVSAALARLSRFEAFRARTRLRCPIRVEHRPRSRRPRRTSAESSGRAPDTPRNPTPARAEDGTCAQSSRDERGSCGCRSRRPERGAALARARAESRAADLRCRTSPDPS